MTQPIQVIYKMLGLRIRSTREALGWRQQELAEKIGLTRTSVVNIEAGRQRLLLHDVEKIAVAFHVTPKHLLRGIWT
jgi:transcriptional regulator with XRE-family HTH domain